MPSIQDREAIFRISPAITLDCSNDAEYVARVFGCGCRVSSGVMCLLANLLDRRSVHPSLMPARHEAIVAADFEETLGGNGSLVMSCAMAEDGRTCEDVRPVSIVISSTCHAIKVTAMVGDDAEDVGNVDLPPICRSALRAIAEERVCDAMEMFLMAMADLLDTAIRRSPRTHQVRDGNATVLWTYVGSRDMTAVG